MAQPPPVVTKVCSEGNQCHCVGGACKVPSRAKNIWESLNKHLIDDLGERKRKQMEWVAGWCDRHGGRLDTEGHGGCKDKAGHKFNRDTAAAELCTHIRNGYTDIHAERPPVPMRLDHCHPQKPSHRKKDPALAVTATTTTTAVDRKGHKKWDLRPDQMWRDTWVLIKRYLYTTKVKRNHKRQSPKYHVSNIPPENWVSIFHTLDGLFFHSMFSEYKVTVQYTTDRTQSFVQQNITGPVLVARREGKDIVLSLDAFGMDHVPRPSTSSRDENEEEEEDTTSEDDDDEDTTSDGTGMVVRRGEDDDPSLLPMPEHFLGRPLGVRSRVEWVVYSMVVQMVMLALVLTMGSADDPRVAFDRPFEHPLFRAYAAPILGWMPSPWPYLYGMERTLRGTAHQIAIRCLGRNQAPEPPDMHTLWRLADETSRYVHVSRNEVSGSQVIMLWVLVRWYGLTVDVLHEYHGEYDEAPKKPRPPRSGVGIGEHTWRHRTAYRHHPVFHGYENVSIDQVAYCTISVRTNTLHFRAVIGTRTTEGTDKWVALHPQTGKGDFACRMPATCYPAREAGLALLLARPSRPIGTAREPVHFFPSHHASLRDQINHAFRRPAYGLHVFVDRLQQRRALGPPLEQLDASSDFGAVWSLFEQQCDHRQVALNTNTITHMQLPYSPQHTLGYLGFSGSGTDSSPLGMFLITPFHDLWWERMDINDRTHIASLSMAPHPGFLLDPGEQVPVTNSNGVERDASRLKPYRSLWHLTGHVNHVSPSTTTLREALRLGRDARLRTLSSAAPAPTTTTAAVVLPEVLSTVPQPPLTEIVGQQQTLVRIHQSLGLTTPLPTPEEVNEPLQHDGLSSTSESMIEEAQRAGRFSVNHELGTAPTQPSLPPEDVDHDDVWSTATHRHQAVGDGTEHNENLDAWVTYWDGGGFTEADGDAFLTYG